MKNSLLVLFVFLAGWCGAQVSINAGTSMLVGFTSPGPWGGFHIGVEVPRDDAVSIYGRYTHHFKRYGDSLAAYAVPIDPGSFLPTQSVMTAPSMNYNIIEGGTRYYLGNGFDYGFAAYGGSCLMLIFNTVKAKTEAFDESLYKLDESSRYEGSIFSLAFGLGGGVKYSTVRFGTYYLDLNLAYMIFGQPNNANIYGNLYNPLIFNFNLGWRKDILW